MKKFLNEFELYLGAICSGVMVTILFMQVVSRYVFNNAFSWAEELGLIFFIFSIYFGATAAIHRNQHLRLTVILDKLSPKKRLVLEIVDNIFFGIFNFIMLGGIIPIVKNLLKNQTETAVTGIPKFMIYCVIPFCFCLMIIRLAQDCYKKYKEIQELKNTHMEILPDKSISTDVD